MSNSIDKQNNAINAIESFVKSLDKTLSLKIKSDKQLSNMRSGLIKQSQKKKKDQKQTVLDYLEEFEALFIGTPINQRRILIDQTNAKIELLKSKAQIKGNGYELDTLDQIQKSAIQNFIPLIDSMKYTPSIQETKSLNKTKNNSFNLKASISYESINELRKKLIDYKFISQSTTSAEFKSVFSHNFETHKVDWKRKGELKHFIKEMISKELLTDESIDKWIITSNCFTVEGEPLDSTPLRKTPISSSLEAKSKLTDALTRIL